MTNRLTSWKSNFLNMAGKTTLASSTLNSIPNHIMQYNYLPIKIIKHIDKIQKIFIWGSTNISKRIYLVSWDTVTRDNNGGGLGIHLAKEKPSNFG